MPIIYSVVARGPVILAEASTQTGNYVQVVNHILEKVEEGSNNKMTFVYDRYLFHYLHRDNVIYLCLADDTFGRRIPFAFLDEIAKRFEAAYSPERAQSTIAYGLNEFSKTIQQQMEYYSNPSADKIRQVQGEIDVVKDVMVSNIEKVLERGERIDILVDKTDSLNQASFAFKKRSTALRRQMWWKNTRLMIILGIVLAVMLYMIVEAFKMLAQSTGWLAEEDDDAEYSQYVEERALEGPIQATTDDASDYYPSDDEDEISSLPRNRLTLDTNVFDARANPHIQEMQARFGNLVECFVATMSKYNTDKGRWVQKGPVVISVMVVFPARITASYMYGTKSLALNLRVFPILDYIMNVNRLRVLFSTFGVNAINTTATQVFETTIGDFYPSMAGDATKIKYCQSDIIPIQEERGSPICFKFKNCTFATRFVNDVNACCHSERQRLEEERRRSFLDPQRVHSCHSSAVSTTQRVELNCPYRNYADWIDTFVANGWMYFPLEDDIKGTFYNNLCTICQFCRVIFTGWIDRVDVPLKHRELAISSGRVCPFGVPDSPVWNGRVSSFSDSPVWNGRVSSFSDSANICFR
ncbi:hypothetical protein SeMB42_g03289 [Synchytrium endobioticum]|uniref:Synaptobrevin homolog YKT6 n=1 Tax=Synchytrium endobioticum TaxID=286115 RepID=A0A507D803_9FUNG|nr:hypothetical protein SeMB42_g03289 [Synchytrium endobioticum]TPX49296.1 hypothetical protein SeLEV6574_g01553 [Synchytrium endobioticum]